jgi:hypothetical protein
MHIDIFILNFWTSAAFILFLNDIMISGENVKYSNYYSTNMRSGLTFCYDFITIVQLTNSEESSSSSEANSLATEDVSSIFLNPKINYHVIKCPLLLPILSQIILVHTLSYFPKINFHSSFRCKFRSS